MSLRNTFTNANAGPTSPRRARPEIRRMRKLAPWSSTDPEAGVFRVAGAARKWWGGPGSGRVGREPGPAGDPPRAHAPRLDGDDERDRRDRRSEDLEGRIQAERTGCEP